MHKDIITQLKHNMMYPFGRENVCGARDYLSTLQKLNT